MKRLLHVMRFITKSQADMTYTINRSIITYVESCILMNLKKNYLLTPQKLQIKFKQATKYYKSLSINMIKNEIMLNKELR